MRRTTVIIALIAALFAFGRPAAAQPPAPDSLAAAKELVETMRATDQLKALLPMIMQQIKPAIVQGRADVDRDYDVIMPMLISGMEARMQELVTAMGAIYASHFNADELRQLTAFYKAPVGQKFLQIMPVIMRDSMTVGQKFGESVAADLQSRMVDELKKRGHKL
jgi:hypothetical protein